MSASFVWEAPRVRVVLARGALERVPDEVARLGSSRVLLVATGSAAEAVARLASSLAGSLAGTVTGVARHVPADLAAAATGRARELAADALVSVGGGSATGLAKAVALETGLPIVAVPTTYSGSEMTPLWGRTAAGRKQTGRDPRVQPRAVVYDPDLCRGMPSRLAAASGMNAIAHCVAALWSPGVSPMTSAFAEDGIRRLAAGVPAAAADPGDVDAHAGNLTGACLAGLTIAEAGAGVHHRLCHAVGGGWDLPHAETHAVLLPHSAALVAWRAPEAVARIARILDAGEAAAGLWELRSALGLPSSLVEIGLPADALDDATARAIEAVAGDPLVPDAGSVAALVESAVRGRPPVPVGA